MNIEVSFYQVNGAIIRSLAPLLLKVLEEKKKALVFCENALQVKEFDLALWGYGRNKFIPHVTIFDREFEFERQPIILSDKEENVNNADYLIFLSEPSEGFAFKFSRIFYLYNEGQFQTKLKPTNSYKKDGDKWVKLF